MTSVRVQVLLRRYHFYCIYPKLQTNISPAFETNAFSSYGIHCICFTIQTLIDKRKPDNIPIAGRKSVLPGVPSCVEVQEQRLRRQKSASLDPVTVHDLHLGRLLKIETSL